MDLKTSLISLDQSPKVNLVGESGPWAEDKSFQAMVALQKWMAKEKRESLPKYSVAKKVLKDVGGEQRISLQEIDKCHRHLMEKDVTLKVCTGSSCKKRSEQPLGAKARAQLSLEESFGVIPSPCMGHCRKGACAQVVVGKKEIEVKHLNKERDYQALYKTLQKVKS